jgi:hypothetical protein
MIPKIIWQTHEFDFKDLHQQFKDSFESWKKHNPDYEVIYVSAAERYEMVADAGLRYLNAYKKIKSGMYQADYWRILVLSKFGGIYADIDTMCKKEIDLPEGDIIVWKVHDDSERDTYTNTYIACTSNNKEMLLILESMTNHILSIPNNVFVNIQDVGTVAYTRHIKELGIKVVDYNWTEISVHGNEDKRLITKQMASKLINCQKCKIEMLEVCFDRSNNPECDKICSNLYDYTHHNIYNRNAILNT